MIFEWLYAAIIGILKTLFSLLPDMVAMPDAIIANIDFIINLVFESSHLLGFFIRISTIKVFLPLLLLVLNFEHIYNFILWIIKKIPISIE